MLAKGAKIALLEGMSSTSTVVTTDLFQYIQGLGPGDDALLQGLKAAAEKAGIPAIWISPEQGHLMQVLLRLAGARRVVEVGTLAGYSALWMARALPAGGTLDTLELSPVHAAFARDWIGRSEVADRVRVHEGPAADQLPAFAAASADAFFIDADKKSYPRYFEEALRILRPGGLLLVDNAFAFGQILDPAATDPDVAAIRRFNQLVSQDSRVDGTIVAIGDGLWVGVKRDAPAR